MSKPKRKTYTVSAYIKAIVEIELDADTLADAAEKAKGLSSQDFITIEGSLADLTLSIQGVSDSKMWDDLNK